jgi:pimeloyl-ACP methyl ester carboxylesterase
MIRKTTPWLATLALVAAAHGAPSNLKVGSMILERCSPVPAYCGRLDRALDPTGAAAGRISIYFEFYPHTAAGKSTGTMVATEGGPGYPATESRDDYLYLWRPLRASRDLLLMDNRGTGKSGALDCPELQTAEKWTIELVARCGASLGGRSALYSTAYAADDLAAILSALDIGRIDLYGDSYGTYFEQVFAVRHPQALRSVVLDGAYPIDGPDYAWYPNYAPAMRAKFNLACARDAHCARIPGNSLDHMTPGLARLRSAPFDAEAADSDGKTHIVHADAAALATVMFGSAPALASVRELDAAMRAFMHEDRAPLLRLMAETITGVDSRDPTDNPVNWSAGLAAAVMCHDPPQIIDMRLDPPSRAMELERVLAARRRDFPDSYAPFTLDEYRGIPLDYNFLDQCVGWPVAPAGHPASQVVPADAPYPDVPALVLSGEFDNMTTVADGAQVARAFGHGRQIEIANSFHVNALPRSRSTCGADIARHFIRTLSVGDASCAAEVPPLPLVPLFAAQAADLEPAVALGHNAANQASLRYAAAAVQSAGDVLARIASNGGGEGPGLRGGTFHIRHRGDAVRITLHAVRFTSDLAVSGTIDVSASHRGRVRARLVLAGSPGVAGRLQVDWQQGTAGSSAQIRGVIDGRAVRAQSPAPY